MTLAAASRARSLATSPLPLGEWLQTSGLRRPRSARPAHSAAGAQASAGEQPAGQAVARAAKQAARLGVESVVGLRARLTSILKELVEASSLHAIAATTAKHIVGQQSIIDFILQHRITERGQHTCQRGPRIT